MKLMLMRVLSRIYLGLHNSYLNTRFQHLVSQGRVVVGRHTYGIPTVHAWPDESKLIIGSFTSIAVGVNILLGGNHPTNWISTFPLRIKLNIPGAWKDGMPASKGNVVIGSDVWIGYGTTILSGVHIGDGAVISAGSLIVENVPPYAIVGGVPGKIIRMRFPGKEVEQLTQIAWWYWDDDAIVKATTLLSSGELDSFINKFGIPK